MYRFESFQRFSRSVRFGRPYGAMHSTMFPLTILLLLPLIQLTTCQFFYQKLRESGTHSLYGETVIIFDRIQSSGQWEFIHPSIKFQLKFTSIEFYQTATSCQGYLRIWNGNEQVNIDCKKATTGVTFNPRYNNNHYWYDNNNRYGYHYRMRIEGSNVKFTAVITLCPWLADPFAVNRSEKGDLDQYIIHSYPPEILSDTSKDKESDSAGVYDYIDNLGIVSTEIVTSDEFTGTVLKNCSILQPRADIPSCHADDLQSCGWSSTVIADYYNKTTKIQGKAFEVGNNLVEFETRNNALYLEKICVNIMYMSNGSSVVKFYIRERHDRKGLISSTVLNACEVFDNRRIISFVPEHLKGTPVQIIIQITGSNMNPVYIKRIYGCNPYTNEDRYAMPEIQDRNEKIAYTLKGLETVTFNKIANIPYGLKELSEDPRCLHGGKSDGSRCVCPAGFIGDDCRTGCGENKFGPRCESRCSFNKNKCRGKLICRPNVGCSCAAGWRGRYCNVECPDYRYGGGCRATCGRCRDGTPCDHFTGVCIRGCQPGYVPPLCQTKNTYVIEKPAVTEITYNSAIVTMNIQSDTYDDIHFYMVQYKNLSAGSNIWFETPVKELRHGSNIEERLQSLKAGIQYAVRFVTFNNDMYSYEEDDLPSAEFETYCVENALNIRDSASETKIYLEWIGTSEDVNRCDSKSHEVQVLFGSEWLSYSSINNRINITSLLPGSKYVIRIRENRENAVFYFKSVTTLRNGKQPD